MIAERVCFNYNTQKQLLHDQYAALALPFAGGDGERDGVGPKGGVAVSVRRPITKASR